MKTVLFVLGVVLAGCSVDETTPENDVNASEQPGAPQWENGAGRGLNPCTGSYRQVGNLIIYVPTFCNAAPWHEDDWSKSPKQQDKSNPNPNPVEKVLIKSSNQI